MSYRALVRCHAIYATISICTLHGCSVRTKIRLPFGPRGNRQANYFSDWPVGKIIQLVACLPSTSVCKLTVVVSLKRLRNNDTFDSSQESFHSENKRRCNPRPSSITSHQGKKWHGRLHVVQESILREPSSAQPLISLRTAQENPGLTHICSHGAPGQPSVALQTDPKIRLKSRNPSSGALERPTIDFLTYRLGKSRSHTDLLTWTPTAALGSPPD